MRRSLLLPVLLAGTFVPGGAAAQERPPADRPAGLAARYPADRGLRDDPDVLLFEDFDGVDLRTVVARWDEASNSGDAVLALSDDVPAPVSGANRHSLQLTAHPGRDSGGHLYRQLPRGVDELFLRFYVKFPAPPMLCSPLRTRWGIQSAHALAPGGGRQASAG